MRTVITILLAFCTSAAVAQTVGIRCSYEYSVSPQLDKLVQTYNFSRPFLQEKQPLLRQGFNVSGTYLFTAKRHISKGVELSYSKTGSSAVNNGTTNTYALHLLKPGYLFHCNAPLHLSHVSAECGAYALLYLLARNENHHTYKYDDTRAISRGAGAQLFFRLAYRFDLGHQYNIAPFIAAAYAPYIYAPRNEAVINQTQGLLIDSHISMRSVQFGVVLSINHKHH